MNDPEASQRLTEALAKDQGRLVGYARRRLPDSAGQEAEDVLSDVVLRLLEQADAEQQLGLSEALSLLSTAERAVWLAVEMEGFSFKELAEMWNEPIGTLLSRKSRATKSLQRIMAEG
jgi:DNA-directed RNA polymerase specialized sigma24 family protein